MISVTLETPKDVQEALAQRFRNFRLYRNFKRSTLAEMSGVPESTIKRFERNGEVSIRALLRLAHSLGALDQFDKLFILPAAASLEEIEEREERLSGPKRKRGRK